MPNEPAAPPWGVDQLRWSHFIHSEILGLSQEAIKAKKRRRAQKAGGAPGALGLGLKTPSFEWVVAPKGVVVS